MRLLEPRDMEGILRMALREGGSSDIAEFRLPHETNPSGCFVLEEKGKLLGGVMTFRHRRSAWIGNLIIAPKHRGRGFGTDLLKRALEYLDKAKVETIYLSAAMGVVDLYEKFGFEKVSGINRWERLPGTNCAMLHVPNENIMLRANEVLRLDAGCWRDDRLTLFPITINPERASSPDLQVS